MRRIVLATWWLSLVPGLCLAQVAPVRTQTPQPKLRRVTVERSYNGSYSESVSRELFTACDSNSDDRLDVLEAASAFETLRSPRDSESFARFDVDRDGFVTWPEFDQRFRRGIDKRGTFSVKTSRPFVEPAPPPQPATPLQQFMQLHDANRDGGLSPAEIDQLLAQLSLPETLGGPLRALDFNGSGRIEDAELAPWFEMLPPAARQLGMPQADPNAPPPLPQPWLDVDADKNSSIGIDELRQLLLRIDPLLDPWLRALFAALDLNADKQLTRDELPLPPSTEAGDPRRSPGRTSQPTAARADLRPPQR